MTSGIPSRWITVALCTFLSENMDSEDTLCSLSYSCTTCVRLLEVRCGGPQVSTIFLWYAHCCSPELLLLLCWALFFSAESSMLSFSSLPSVLPAQSSVFILCWAFFFSSGHFLLCGGHSSPSNIFLLSGASFFSAEFVLPAERFSSVPSAFSCLPSVINCYSALHAERFLSCRVVFLLCRALFFLPTCFSKFINLNFEKKKTRSPGAWRSAWQDGRQWPHKLDNTEN